MGEGAVLDPLAASFDGGAPVLISADAVDPRELLARLGTGAAHATVAPADRWSMPDALSVADLSRRTASERYPVALYQYTGGTTGRSKAAVISAANLLATAKLVSDFFAGFGEPIGRGDALTPLPLYHIFAFLFGMLVYLRAGTHNVVVPSSLSAGLRWRQPIAAPLRKAHLPMAGCAPATSPPWT